MNPSKFSSIAHREHTFCNPVASVKIDRILELLPLDAEARALDLGCARGELAVWTRRGAYVLIGEGYWQKRPSAECLVHLEGTEDEFRDHRGNVQAGIDAGLVPLHASVASADDWDEYEWKYSASIERYAIEQPDDPDVPAMLERIRRWRDGYLRWGPDTLGFGLYLFHRSPNVT
jgi:hypothetical protein